MYHLAYGTEPRFFVFRRWMCTARICMVLFVRQTVEIVEICTKNGKQQQKLTCHRQMSHFFCKRKYACANCPSILRFHVCFRVAYSKGLRYGDIISWCSGGEWGRHLVGNPCRLGELRSYNAKFPTIYLHRLLECYTPLLRHFSSRLGILVWTHWYNGKVFFFVVPGSV